MPDPNPPALTLVQVGEQVTVTLPTARDGSRIGIQNLGSDPIEVLAPTAEREKGLLEAAVTLLRATREPSTTEEERQRIGRAAGTLEAYVADNY